MLRLGVVSFLNSRPLIAGLDRARGVELFFDVPSLLPGRLERGEVDVALIPTIDILRSRGRYVVVSDACIGCDGETMTVRVFSQTPPDRMTRLWVDADSHTSVALAAVIWRELFDRNIALLPLERGRQNIDDLESVLLIGDKVVDQRRGSFAYEIDLGGAWRQHTGLPFVFAAWAADGHNDARFEILSQARDRGVADAARIAAEQGPSLGWPVELAERYLTRCLRFKLDARLIEGANLFALHCARAGLIAADTEIVWPDAAIQRVGT